MSEVTEKTSKTPQAPEVPPKARAVVVDPQRMQVAEYVRREWVVTAEEGTSIDDIVHPGYWAHMARQLALYDRIEVRIDTGEFLLELVVKSVGPNWAQVAVLQHHKLVGVADEETSNSHSELDVKFKGPIRKWCVVRKSDDEILHEKEESKLAASTWAAQYESTILGR
jgi:hypothetical protein